MLLGLPSEIYLTFRAAGTFPNPSSLFDQNYSWSYGFLLFEQLLHREPFLERAAALSCYEGAAGDKSIRLLETQTHTKQNQPFNSQAAS